MKCGTGQQARCAALEGAWVGLGEPASLPARAGRPRPARRRDFAAVENRAGERRPLRELSGCFLALPAGVAPADRRHLPLRPHRRRHRRRRRRDRPTERVADLDAYRADLLAVAADRPPSPRWPEVFDPAGATIAAHRLPLPLLGDLLTPSGRTRVQTRYADRAELLDYCRRSANPIGRLLLHLYGVTDARSLAQSDAICSAPAARQLLAGPRCRRQPRPALRARSPTALRHGVASRRAAGAAATAPASAPSSASSSPGRAR